MPKTKVGDSSHTESSLPSKQNPLNTAEIDFGGVESIAKIISNLNAQQNVAKEKNILKGYVEKNYRTYSLNNRNSIAQLEIDGDTTVDRVIKSDLPHVFLALEMLRGQSDLILNEEHVATILKNPKCAEANVTQWFIASGQKDPFLENLEDREKETCCLDSCCIC